MENLEKDIEMIQRDYSSFRCANKWRTNRFAYIPGQEVLEDENYLKVIRKTSGFIDYYPISSLLKRQQIKRSEAFYNEFQILWDSVNPGRIKGISKAVYLVVVEFYYKTFQQATANPRITQSFLAKDTEVDFEGKTCLTFCEFYDIIFEVVDSMCKSSLASEYSRCIHSSLSHIFQSPAFTSLNLFSKIHITDTPRPSTYVWMHKVLRSLTPTKTQLPDILKPISTTSVAPKFLSRVQTRNHIDKIPLKWSVLKYAKEIDTRRSTTPTLSKNSTAKFNKRASPLLQSNLKGSQETYIIEEIVKKRKVNM